MNLVTRAANFAKFWHAEQKRKYTNDPYWVHLERVAKLCGEAGADQETIAAAWMHDVLEDTACPVGNIRELFGSTIALYVRSVTDVSRPHHGNRAVRKAMDREHLAKAPPAGKTIKLADMIDNLNDIVVNDPKFATVFLNEKVALLPHLRGGSRYLLRIAVDTIKESKQKLKEYRRAA